MCDCSSEESSRQPIAVKSCDCTSEDDESEKAKIKIHTAVVAKAEILQTNNATDSCDCTTEDDDDSDAKSAGTGTTESCDCTSEEDGVDAKKEIPTTDEDHSKSPFAIVQVELSESMLKLMPSSESSTSCDCTTTRSSDDGSLQEDKQRSSEDKEASCDCTSEESEESRSEDDKDEKKLEWTLAMIKPDAMKYRREIERIIEDEEGFSICQRRWLQLTAEQASEFYRDDYERKDFARLVAYMSSEPIAVYVLYKLDAIAEWRMLMGPSRVSQARVYAPDSIRGRFGGREDDDDEMRNAVHGSWDARAAEREIHFFFPDCIMEPVLRDGAAEEYLQRERMNEVLSEALVKCCEAKPDEPLLWLANWLLNYNKPRYLLRSTSNLYD